jgi:hypothetical protein
MPWAKKASRHCDARSAAAISGRVRLLREMASLRSQ